MPLDRDLQSIQEVRDLIARARPAQEHLTEFTQEQVDRIVDAMAQAGYNAREELARMAVDETGFGKYEDKIIKNEFVTKTLAEYVRPMRTAGFVCEDRERMVWEIAVPMGIVAGIIPSTNPTSTAMYKAIISLKARNTVIFSPHPKAVRCTVRAAEIMDTAAREAGAPKGCIGCMETVTLESTQELMRHGDVGVILATGGTAMVKAAYSSGKPAYGVGPGNVPSFIERTANIPEAVRHIILGKTFDNGTICASEQSVIVEEAIDREVQEQFSSRGCHFLNREEKNAVENTLVLKSGGVNPAVVGQPAEKIADLAGIRVPRGTRVLIAFLDGVGPDHPLSIEKLSPVLAYYRARNWIDACDRAIELLRHGGMGHTMSIHSQNDEIIREFALKKPAFRIIANSPATHGAVGYSTGLPPSLTLGCGTWGGGISSDNITPLHLIHLKRLAYGIRQVHPSVPEDEPLKPGTSTGETEGSLRKPSAPGVEKVPVKESSEARGTKDLSDAEIDRIIEDFLHHRDR
jgi:acetaldehyde dehydrogenase (acetylating)